MSRASRPFSRSRSRRGKPSSIGISPPSANLVRRFVQMHALTGHALILNGRVVGYSYFVCEDGKGLIGDLYILKQHRTPENEYPLFQASLDAMWQTPGVHRVESQLMMLSETSTIAVCRTPPGCNSYPRLFLEAPLSAGVAQARPRLLHRTWCPGWKAIRRPLAV